MRFVDWVDDVRARQEAGARTLEGERKQRRSSPVRTPVRLPWNIRGRIASYLRLEFGESRWAKGSLKAADLTLVGEWVVDGVPTQFWRYPSSAPRGHDWAIVERFDDHFSLGFADGPPPDR
jgi:hypothetical protein